MTTGAIYRVSTGTLTIKSVAKGKDALYTLMYNADKPEYSCEVQMAKEHVKRLDNLINKVI